MADIATNGDVAALVAAEWVSPEDFSKVPSVKNRSNFIVYGPLRDMTLDPNVVFIRLNGKQLMMVHDAWPGARMEGKPQCHIIPIAKEDGEVAVACRMHVEPSSHRHVEQRRFLRHPLGGAPGLDRSAKTGHRRR